MLLLCTFLRSLLSEKSSPEFLLFTGHTGELSADGRMLCIAPPAIWNATSNIWGGRRIYWELTEQSAAAVSFWHDETELTTRETRGFHCSCSSTISPNVSLFSPFYLLRLQLDTLLECSLGQSNGLTVFFIFLTNKNTLHMADKKNEISFKWYANVFCWFYI